MSGAMDKRLMAYRKHKRGLMKVLSVFDCSICSSVMTVPLIYCRKGHGYCQACVRKCFDNSCLLCGKNIKMKNELLDRLSECFFCPCRYFENGCSKFVPNEDYDAHCNACIFRPYECYQPDCLFKGPRAALIQHVTKQHPGQFAVASSFALKWRRLDLAEPFRHVKLILSFNQLFWFYFSNSPEKRRCIGGVQIVATKNIAAKFHYEFEMLGLSPEREPRSIVQFTREAHNEETRNSDIETFGFWLRHRYVIPYLHRPDEFLISLVISRNNLNPVPGFPKPSPYSNPGPSPVRVMIMSS
nr:PREDICTED: E3 ubiquitin-protein ligase Siah1-like [Bemisia tabaci]